MLVFGAIGLLMEVKGFSPSLAQSMSLKPILLPLAIFVPTVIGLIYQQTQYSLPSGAAPPPKK